MREDTEGRGDGGSPLTIMLFLTEFQKSIGNVNHVKIEV